MPQYFSLRRGLNLSRSLAIAADNLHFIRKDGTLVVQFEVDIFDKERPDFIAESVGIQVSLSSSCQPPILSRLPPYTELNRDQANLERKLDLHFIRKHLGNHTVKGRENLHRKLGFDPAFVDQVVERISEGKADASRAVSSQPCAWKGGHPSPIKPETEHTCSRGRAHSMPASSW